MLISSATQFFRGASEGNQHLFSVVYSTSNWPAPFMQQVKSHCISYSTQACLLPSELVRGSELGIYSRETHTCIRTHMAVTLRNVLHVGFQHVHGFPACGFLACGFPAYGFLACKFPGRLAIRVCLSGGNIGWCKIFNLEDQWTTMHCLQGLQS